MIHGSSITVALNLSLIIVGAWLSRVMVLTLTHNFIELFTSFWLAPNQFLTGQFLSTPY